MGKISIADIARRLAESNGLEQQEAEAFVNDFFDAIKQGLETDSLVKVKGFGTFKIIDVEARSSVSVNTGERVVIDSHGKVTFTPDSTMKELVNKPFSQFETVVLNEGVTFDDEVVDDNPAEEEQQAEVDEKPQAVEEQPVEEQSQMIEEQAESEAATVEPRSSETADDVVEAPAEELQGPAEQSQEPKEQSLEPVEQLQESTEQLQEPAEQLQEPTETVVEEAEAQPEESEEIESEETAATEKSEETKNEEVLSSEESQDTVAEEVVVETNEDDDEPKGTFWKKVWVGIIVFFVIVLAFGAGYLIGLLFGSINNNEPVYDAQDVETAQVVENTQAVDSLSNDSLSSDTLKTVVPGVASDSIKAANNSATTGSAVSQVQDEDDPDYLKYNRMDKRLSTGGWFIMGTKTVHVVREGQSLRRIARHWLGDGELVCYIEVFNGITTKDTLRAGQEIKIPLLKTKQSVWRKNRKKDL